MIVGILIVEVDIVVVVLSVPIDWSSVVELVIIVSDEVMSCDFDVDTPFVTALIAVFVVSVKGLAVVDVNTDVSVPTADVVATVADVVAEINFEIVEDSSVVPIIILLVEVDDNSVFVVTSSVVLGKSVGSEGTVAEVAADFLL